MVEPSSAEKERREQIAAVVMAALVPAEGQTDGRDNGLCVTEELIEAISEIPTG